MAARQFTFADSVADFFGGTRRDARLAAERQESLKRTFEEMRSEVKARTDQLCDGSLAVRTETYVTDNLAAMREMRERRVQAEETAYKRMSWWSKLNAEDEDYTAIDKCIPRCFQREKSSFVPNDFKTRAGVGDDA